MEPDAAALSLGRNGSATPAIRLVAITKRFPRAPHPAVEGLTLDIARGSIVALIGPSGCGKTTTLRMINRLIEPTSGRIEIAGVDVTRSPVAGLRRGIGYVIQQVGLFPHRTIAQNIGTVPRTLGWERERVTARIDELVDLVGLDPSMLDRFPDELSGGQQQRVGVARALAADPPVLLMDEPFGAVDPIVRARLQDELIALQERVHKTIVLVTHDIDEAIKLADQVAILNVGGVIEQLAPPDEILRAPASEFVERFVGHDRASKRLTLAQVRDLPFDRGPVVDVGASIEEARQAMDAYRSDWVGLIDGERFAGWVDGRELRGDDRGLATAGERPAAVVAPDSTLLHAMEIILTSSTSVAIVEDEGRFRGAITLEGIRAALTEGVAERAA